MTGNDTQTQLTVGPAQMNPEGTTQAAFKLIIRHNPELVGPS
jgi:hypothetical protein